MDDFPPTGPAPRTRRWPTVLGTVVALLLVAAVVTSNIHTQYFALSPGQAEQVSPLITVPAGRAHTVHGSILLTDVLETESPVSWLEYLPDKWNHDVQLVPASELLSPGIPNSQLLDQGFLEMAQSQSFAKYAALTRLGYRVGSSEDGVVVVAVTAKVPASSVLHVGDVVTGVDGTATPTVCAFVAALHALNPGQPAQLRVEKAAISPDGAVGTGATVDERVVMAPAPKGQPASGCPGVRGANRAVLGVEAEQQYGFRFPFPVSVNTQNIGGPSAGLAMTLGILDKLTTGRMTGHQVVAATGTIDPEGQVGQVGGVPQKTIAVERSGATVFMVPDGQRGDAQSKAVPGLHICTVATLGQALGVLARFGGDVPASLHPQPLPRGTCT